MIRTVPDLDLPAITTPDRLVPPVSSDEALRWRLARHAGSKPVPRARPQGEPFVWIETEVPPPKS